LSSTRNAAEAYLAEARETLLLELGLIASDQNMKVLVMSEDERQLGRLCDSLLTMAGFDFVAFTDSKGKVLAARNLETLPGALSRAGAIGMELEDSFSGLVDDEVLGPAIVGASKVEFGMQKIGAVVAGYAFSTHKFADILNRNLDVHATVFEGDTRISSTITQDGERITGTPLADQEAARAVLEEGKIHTALTSIMGRRFFATYWPLTTHDGQIAGIMAIAQETTAMDDLLASINRGVLYAGLGVGLVMFVLGILFARRISSPVRKLSDYARAVAQGEVDRRVDIRRKDELGDLARDMNSIPETIAAMTAEFQGVATQIRAGRLGVRGDSSRFQGAYARIIEDANDLADMFTGFFEELPTPVMAVDTSQNILFINRAGAELDGKTMEELIGTKCFDHFKTSDCNGNCAIRQSMRECAKATGQTDAHPGGADIHISYTAMPITDDAGKVVGAFEIVFDQTEIVGASNRLKTTATNAQDIATRLADMATQLSAHVEQSTRGAESQRANVSETATAMEEMSASILEVAKNSGSAAENGDEAKAKAREGRQVVEQVVESIGRLSALSETLKLNMADLDNKAQDIGKVMNVINDIADQTNLLALNAAIEAARAGEAGRGFAVVADEVRKLAEKTMEATKEVGAAIETIQAGTKNTIGEAEKAARAVAEGADLARMSGETLNAIVGLSESTADQVRNIATAAEQQSSSAEEINRASSEIDRLSQESSQAMRQTAEAVTQLADLAKQLQSLIDQL